MLGNLGSLGILMKNKAFRKTLKPKLVEAYGFLMELSYEKCKDIELWENEIATHIILISHQETKKCHPYVVTMDKEGNISRTIEKLDIKQLIDKIDDI
jgi:hypothetical protein